MRRRFLSLPKRAQKADNAKQKNARAQGCWENNSCCETSHKRSGPPVQPLAKAGSDQPNIAILASTVPVAVFDQVATELFVFLSAECSAHSPPPLTLICIRLI